MQIDMPQFVTQVALMFIGSIGTWAVWVTVMLFKTRKDVDIAFSKIRNIEKDKPCKEH